MLGRLPRILVVKLSIGNDDLSPARKQTVLTLKALHKNEFVYQCLTRIIHELDVHRRKPLHEKELRLSCPKRCAKVTRSVSEGNTGTSSLTLRVTNNPG